MKYIKRAPPEPSFVYLAEAVVRNRITVAVHPDGDVCLLVRIDRLPKHQDVPRWRWVALPTGEIQYGFDTKKLALEFLLDDSSLFSSIEFETKQEFGKWLSARE